ncbi:uncharacterized protein LOC123926607 [Meles meles]|uniref:uncharacterized protein LOC123926607 n=1 Tax=Meles meles TaxID=9662 RepID=UPI001E69F9EE|nr:uncharacterized protein LOC123926607 [Meles meles]
MLAVQRMRPDVLLQRPPKRESLKVAAGVSRGERGAGAPRGRREGARVPCALAKTWWRVPHRPVQAEREAAHCGGTDREVRELSTAAKRPWRLALGLDSGHIGTAAPGVDRGQNPLSTCKAQYPHRRERPPKFPVVWLPEQKLKGGALQGQECTGYQAAARSLDNSRTCARFPRRRKDSAERRSKLRPQTRLQVRRQRRGARPGKSGLWEPGWRPPWSQQFPDREGKGASSPGPRGLRDCECGGGFPELQAPRRLLPGGPRHPPAPHRWHPFLREAAGGRDSEGALPGCASRSVGCGFVMGQAKKALKVILTRAKKMQKSECSGNQTLMPNTSYGTILKKNHRLAYLEVVAENFCSQIIVPARKHRPRGIKCWSTPPWLPSWISLAVRVKTGNGPQNLCFWQDFHPYLILSTHSFMIITCLEATKTILM